MGLKDIIRCKETIKENEELKEKVKELESLIMPEHQQISDLNDRIKNCKPNELFKYEETKSA